jgi:UPF0755 protein
LAAVWVAVALAVGAIRAAGQWRADEDNPTPVQVTLSHGATPSAAARQLHQAGVLRYPWLFRAHLWTSTAPLPRAGAHTVHRAMTVGELAEAVGATSASSTAPFPIVEGMRLRDVDDALSRAGLIAPGAYLTAAHQPGRFKAPFPLPASSLEGYLGTHTWHLPFTPLDVDAFLQKQVDVFAERVLRPLQEDVAQSSRPLHQLITVASLVAREEPNDAQRPLIAGIIYKRLDAGIPLGIDATSRYPLRSWTDEAAFRDALKDPDDPYNTRLKPGLPPTPLGTLYRSALHAALHPQMGPWLYYLHDGQGVLHPARNAAEHDENRRRYGVW